MQITFTIPDEKTSRVIGALVGLFPPPAGFTNEQWARECVRRWIRNQVARWEQSQQIKAIPFTPDDSLVT